MATKVENEDSSVAFAVRLMQHLVVPTFVLDDQRRVIIWNRACERLTGVRSAEVIGTRDQWRGFYEAPRYCLADLVALGRAEQLGDLYEAHTVHDDSSLGLCAEVWCVMPCVGKRLYLAVDAGPIYDEDGKLIAVVETLRDMTEQKLAQTALQGLHLAERDALEHEILERTQVEKQLAFATFHDELTGLSNRAFLMDRLNELVAKKHAGSHFWAILFLDLDRFKVINDSLGHIVGDLVLVEVARRLERCLRSGDTLVRLGGDEFVILLEDIEDVEAACDVARRVEHSLGVPFTVAGRGVFASASIGIATSLNRDDLPEDVLRNADIAMYRAKQLGKQRYELFTPDMLASAVSRLEIETDLLQAIERGEFRVFYQPILSAHEARLTGFEALVRWEHPQRGIVEPDEFISVAEENGAIVAIGEWVLRQACRQLQAWREASAAANDLRMNVNVSAKQLALPDFAQIVQSALIASGLDPDGLNVEITESALMSNADLARATLVELRRMGVHIHLDDFGTGYSSLAYLRDFPIDALKIDRSFVGYSNPDVGLASIEIVRMIIALAQSLSLTVTAEGVETDEQHEQLRTLGCTNAQGFLFSRPVDALKAGAMIGTYFAGTPSACVRGTAVL